MKERISTTRCLTKVKTMPMLRGDAPLAGGTGRMPDWAPIGPGTKAKTMLSDHTSMICFNYRRPQLLTQTLVFPSLALGSATATTP